MARFPHRRLFDGDNDQLHAKEHSAVVFLMEITISFMQRSIQLSSSHSITMARFSRRRPFDGQYDKPRCEVFPVH